MENNLSRLYWHFIFMGSRKCPAVQFVFVIFGELSQKLGMVSSFLPVPYMPNGNWSFALLQKRTNKLFSELG